MMLAFTACKSKTETTPPITIEQPVEVPSIAIPTAFDIANNITIPSFENADVTKFCQDFKTLMIEYATSKGTGDNVKATELENKFTNWATQATQLAGKIKPEGMSSFNDFITLAQNKFQEIGQASSAN